MNKIDITKTCLFKYTENFTSKKWKFSIKKKKKKKNHDSAQNIDCGYSLEPPRRGGSNEYPQSMFWTEIRKIMYTPVNPSFTIQKWGLKGSKLYRHVFAILLSWNDMHVSRADKSVKKSRTGCPKLVAMHIHVSSLWKSIDIYSRYRPETKPLTFCGQITVKNWWNLPICNPKPEYQCTITKTRLFKLLKISPP